MENFPGHDVPKTDIDSLLLDARVKLLRDFDLETQKKYPPDPEKNSIMKHMIRKIQSGEIRADELTVEYLSAAGLDDGFSQSVVWEVAASV